MSDSKKIECPEHGPQTTTFVCCHLTESLKTGKIVGYHCAEEDPEEPYPDAWCDACQNIFEEEGFEWNDRSEAFANINILCGLCYNRARKLNSKRELFSRWRTK